MGPFDSYRELIASGVLRPDAGQASAVARLQVLHDTLVANTAQAPDRGGRLLARFRRDRKLHVRRPPGLYLHGGVGRGKSRLMDLFFETAPVAAKQRLHFHEFMQRVHAALHARRMATGGRQDRDSLIDSVAAGFADDLELLCFDEFHVADIADAMILPRLTVALLDAGVTLVATSNFAPRGLYPNGIQRDRFLPFAELIANRLDVVAIDGDGGQGRDYRLARVAGGPVYHTPLGEAARGAMDAAFAALADGSAPQPAALSVNGRALTLPQSARGTLRLSFADLDRLAIGPGDSLAIARGFHTVLLDDIPALAPDDGNRARRLITLIDTLYDHGTRLIVSAAAPPEGLYPDGPLAGEFARSVSRLREMQSADYLAGTARAAIERVA